jgi:putative intracellular protease/amidase
VDGVWSMKVLFIITSSEQGTWLSEVTHPYWHLAERGMTIDLASPAGGMVGWVPRSDPYFVDSEEPRDLVSKGFLSDSALAARLQITVRLSIVDLDRYDAIHVAGGRGATFDLFPNEDVATAIEYFWARDKVVGAICHGAIALANIPERLRGRTVTAFSLEEDRALERQFGGGFVIPRYPQPTLEQVGAVYTNARALAPHVVVDGKLVTGQNQQSASEYGVALCRVLAGQTPLLGA